MNRGEWQDLFNWAWHDVWPNHLGQRLGVDDSESVDYDDDGRARVTEALALTAELYEAERAKGTDHENAKHRVFEAIMRIAGKVPTPPAPTSVLAPLVGYLRVKGSTFHDDTGPRAVLLCHAGDLMMRSTYDLVGAMRGLDAIRAAGYHGIRLWDRLRWGPLDPNKPISGNWGHEIVGMPTWLEQCRAFYGACRVLGLRIHVAAGDLAKFQGGQRADYFAARETLTKEFGNLVIVNEWANESRDTSGGLTSATAERDMAGLRQLPNLVTLTAYTGHEDIALFREWTKPWQSFVQVHGSRGGHWWDKTRHIFSLPYEVWDRRPWLQSEPFGPGPLVSVTDHKNELTGAVMALAAWQAVITGQAWTYFSSPGVVLGRERFEDQPGFFETPRMVAVAERFGKQHGINWGTLRLIHGDPLRDNVLKIATGGHDARIDQAIDAAKGVCFATVYGPEAISANPTPGWSWSWVNPSTAEVVDNVDVTRSMKSGGLVGERK